VERGKGAVVFVLVDVDIVDIVSVEFVDDDVVVGYFAGRMG
jgi:hypothetical protein